METFETPPCGLCARMYVSALAGAPLTVGVPVHPQLQWLALDGYCSAFLFFPIRHFEKGQHLFPCSSSRTQGATGRTSPSAERPLRLTDGGFYLTQPSRHVKGRTLLDHLLSTTERLSSFGKFHGVKRATMEAANISWSRYISHVSLRASVSLRGLHGAVNVLNPMVAHLTGSSNSEVGCEYFSSYSELQCT